MAALITTKYVGPTNTKGSKIRVKTATYTGYVNWDHALDVEENHKAAALSVASKRLAAGTTIVAYATLHDSSGYAFIFDVVRS